MSEHAPRAEWVPIVRARSPSEASQRLNRSVALPLAADVRDGMSPLSSFELECFDRFCSRAGEVQASLRVGASSAYHVADFGFVHDVAARGPVRCAAYGWASRAAPRQWHGSDEQRTAQEIPSMFREGMVHATPGLQCIGDDSSIAYE